MSKMENIVDWDNLKAVIFDIDGTLYDQRKLRRRMLAALLAYYLPRPWRLRELAILRKFRKLREENCDAPQENLADAQYEWCAATSDVPAELVKKIVTEWIFQRPLPLLRRYRCPGLTELIQRLQEKNIAVAYFSDYPAQEKIAALELPKTHAVAATDPAVNRLKPDPAGLLLLLERLQTEIEACLVIGDRDDRDGECARRAGTKFLLFAPGQKARPGQFNNYSELAETIT